MTRSIVFGDSAAWHANGLTHGRLIHYLKGRLGDNPAFAPTFAKADVWNAMDAWYFDDLPLDAVQELGRWLERLRTRDFDMVFVDVNNLEVRALVKADLDKLQRVLGAHVRGLEESSKRGSSGA